MIQLPQGKKSVVTIEIVDDEYVVCKSYNNNGNPAAKCQREIALYRWYENVSGLPQLYGAHCPTHILIELLTGTPATVWSIDKTRSQISKLSFEHGKNMALWIQHAPSDALHRSIATDFPGEANSSSTIYSTLSTVETYVRSNTEFNLPEIRVALESAWRVLEVTGFWGAEVLCKLDWNADNTIINGDRIAGYVDFEQSFFGNRLMFVGTLIDHINVLSWRDVRFGIESGGITLPSAYMQFASACFSMCYKIRGCCRDGSIVFFTPARLIEKFRDMKRMIDEAEQDSSLDVSDIRDL